MTITTQSPCSSFPSGYCLCISQHVQGLAVICMQALSKQTAIGKGRNSMASSEFRPRKNTDKKDIHLHEKKLGLRNLSSHGVYLKQCLKLFHISQLIAIQHRIRELILHVVLKGTVKHEKCC